MDTEAEPSRPGWVGARASRLCGGGGVARPHQRSRDGHAPKQPRRRFSSLGLLLLASAALVSGCKQKPAEAPAPVPVAETALARQLAAARVDAAQTWLREHAPDRALALLVAALAADPESEPAAGLVRQILAETQWHVPVREFRHELPVTQVVFSPPAALWVGLTEQTADGYATAVRWDLAALKITSVLAPARSLATRRMLAGGKDFSLAVQRGSGAEAVELLCRGDTLRPVGELSALPPRLTAQAVTVSSDNGLLIAHPEVVSVTDSRLVWRIHDVATGDEVRKSEPLGDAEPRPVAAQLDARRLRVLRADGSLWELPVSPVETAVCYSAAAPLAVLQARFAADGGKALMLVDQGPGCAPLRQQGEFRLAEIAGTIVAEWVAGTAVPDPAWWEGVPWSREASWWGTLLRDHGDPADVPAVRVGEREVVFCRGSRAPVWEPESLTAMTLSHNTVVTGNADGVVRVHQFLPLPQARETTGKLDAVALAELSAALTGMRYDESSREFVRLEDAERRGLLEKADPAFGRTAVPGLDFAPTLQAARECGWQAAPAAALLPLWERLARADRSGTSWPRWLALGQALGDSRWHQDLTEALARRDAAGAAAVRTGDASPWLAQERMHEVFAKRDEVALKTELLGADGKGPAAATALALALDGDSPEWLAICLNAATDLPPLLRTLGESRRAWLEKRPADAMTLWPAEFPGFEKARAREDWDGWEQADFASRYQAHLRDLNRELATYEVPPHATPVELAALAARLLDPATRGIIGRRRLADNCLKAALDLTAAPEQAGVTFQLASRARALGAQPEPCLRAEALALTRLKDFAQAHPRWIALLTEHPVAAHQAGDYAEAAYTAFENGDPNQALEILGTGVNRFPNDADYALRAGWIALLTANYGRGYQFLLAGLRIGFPEDKRENACLLLTVAASMAGFPEDALSHYNNLVEMAPAWENPATVDALAWPEELKMTLRELLPLP